MTLLLPLLLASTLANAGPSPIPLIDTQAARGKVFRGAMVPFGMMMWGPSRAGYSLTYLSGASMPSQYDNQVPVLPVATDSLGTKGFFDRKDGHPSRPEGKETGEPGYFRSEQRTGEVVELAATDRAGISRIRFAGAGSVLFYLYNEKREARIVSDTELQGETVRGGVRFHFFARFDRPFVAHGSWSNAVYVSFDPKVAAAVTLKLGISFVSAENARLNLETEIPGWDLDAVRATARLRWRDVLSRIEIRGGDDAARRIFYTNYYHLFLGPSIFSDVNGEYLGFDDQIHHVEPGHVQYANFSGWDIYRSWVQLISWLFPHEASDMMQSLVNDAREAGGGMPRWPVANRETGVMDPGSATPIVANAYAFGAREFDTAAAFDILDRSESDPGLRCQSGYQVHEGLEDYLTLGYVPASYENGWRKQAASITLEYALGDFALSRLALELGHPQRAEHYLALSGNWRNLFHPMKKLIVPREASGAWKLFFFPSIGARHGFTEGNSIQYTWMVPQDLRGLIDRMGGDEAAVRRLDHLFRKLATGELRPFADLGNEPSFDIPWVYNWAHAPDRTQSVVRRALTEVFFNGLPGDDDLGETSSWSLWAMLGMYPAVPGLAGVTFASPYFPEAVLHLGSGGTLTIAAERAARENAFVQGLRVNGKAWNRAWMDLAELDARGANRLDFDLSAQPARGWGAAKGEEPPSFPDR